MMQLLRGARSLRSLPTPVVVTIGNFDGVHHGHQALLSSLKSMAKEYAAATLVILFEPQPNEYFHGSSAPTRLTSFRDKIQLLQACGIDYVCCLTFDALFAAMSPLDFTLKIICAPACVRGILVGEDFRFGAKRLGDAVLLQSIASAKHIPVQVFKDVCENEIRVSSTRIRHALEWGQLHEAELCLGRPYSLQGRIVGGQGLGRQWGAPTINVQLKQKTAPLRGVFLVQAQYNELTEKWAGVANIGFRPTLNGKQWVLEVHLLDKFISLHNGRLTVFFLQKLRDEIKFSDLDALFKQIHQDIALARNLFVAFSENIP